MSVKLTNKKEDTNEVVPNENAAPATTKAPKTPKAEKAPVTSGVFMVSSADGSYKYIGTSSRIEVCWKDYSKWLAEKKHGNKEMQAAYDQFGGNLQMTILETCDKTAFTEAKKKHCKDQGVDMKVPFSKDVIKASDIK
jgi:hypothetical protein